MEIDDESRMEELLEEQPEEKKYMKAYKQLFRELTVMKGEEEDSMKEQENSLMDLVKEAIKGDQKSIGRWYKVGKSFIQEIERERKSREKSDKSIRKRIYDREWENYLIYQERQ
jgi:hypothetical protein